MKYQDSKEFHRRDCSAWMCKLPDNTKKLLLFAAGATFEEVHQYCCVHHKVFSLSQITVGEFTVSYGKGDSSYSADSREYDQNFEYVSRA